MIGQQVTIPPIPHGSTVEKIIVGKLVGDLLAAGFKITVNDGEEDVLVHSTDAAAIWPTLASTGSDSLFVYNDETNKFYKNGTNKYGFVLLIWGNGTDIISDYSMRLEPHLSAVRALAEELS